MEPAGLATMTPLARQVRRPAGYLPMTHAEWERWRYPDRLDWELLRRRDRDGVAANGVALTAALVDGAVRAGVEIRTDCRLTGVELDPGGAVTAAVTASLTIPVAAVILATGGFDWDENLRRAWQPAAQRATGAAPGNTGDGLRIACRAGAATANLDQGWWMPMLAVPGEEVDGRPGYRSLIRERALPRQIMVNAGTWRRSGPATPIPHRAPPSASR
jgi:hypothetical protein